MSKLCKRPLNYNDIFLASDALAQLVRGLRAGIQRGSVSTIDDALESASIEIRIVDDDYEEDDEEIMILITRYMAL